MHSYRRQCQHQMKSTFKKLEESIIDGDGVAVADKESVKGNDKEDKKSITEEDGAAIVAESS